MLTDKNYTKWVAAWGNATSITEQKEARYSRDLTLRYPIRCCFSGDMLRLHFSNLTGTEPITLSKVTVARSISDKSINPVTLKPVTFCQMESVTIDPGTEIVSDEISYSISAGEYLSISIYLKEFTQMNAGVLVTGPLSKGFYSYGDHAEKEDLPLNQTRKTNWFYFLNTVDIHTEEQNHALICYGDSITAQSWPDHLALRAWKTEHRNVSIIRRAVSGTRILRQYDCITYAAYGLKGKNRFEREIDVAGADTVLIQHGINDIIHPVGRDKNPFRPWSDLPTAEELTRGIEDIYILPAKEQGLKVYVGTLLPIYGWRTYAPFREELRTKVNEWIRSLDSIDGFVDFDLAVRDPERPEAFADGFDSGDHLHPSEAAYEAMAKAVPKSIL